LTRTLGSARGATGNGGPYRNHAAGPAPAGRPRGRVGGRWVDDGSEGMRGRGGGVAPRRVSRARRRRRGGPGACSSWKTCRRGSGFPQNAGGACIGWKIGSPICSFPRYASCRTFHVAPGVGREPGSCAPHRRRVGWGGASRGATRSGSGGASTAGAGIGIIHSTDSAVDHCRKPTAAPGPRVRRGQSEGSSALPSRRSSRQPASGPHPP
jgi:hypothetical protein